MQVKLLNEPFKNIFVAGEIPDVLNFIGRGPLKKCWK
jgi:hypothetical protein